jgi:CRISPR-associated protein Cas6
MTTLDLLFPVLGTRLPTDHVYPLYGALSRLLPWLHDPASQVALAPLTGRYVGRGQLQLGRGSRLRLRLRAEDVPKALPLSGKGVRVLGQALRLGVPCVQALEPAADLIAHTVAIKNAEEPEAFVAAARRMLDGLGVGGRAEVPSVPAGPRKGVPMRQVLRVKGAAIVCYPLRLSGLSPDESLTVQVSGLGGRRRMGGGFFLPARTAEVVDA